MPRGEVVACADKRHYAIVTFLFSQQTLNRFKTAKAEPFLFQ